MSVKPEIIITEDGSASFRHPVIGDTYHSLRGAETEAMHVFIENGFRYFRKNNLNIFEAGFGSGLNAWLTMREAEETGTKVSYTAVELYPVDTTVIGRTAYAGYPDFMALHEAEWGKPCALTPYFDVMKLNSDLAFLDIDATFDIVYFDMFAPDTQPELWNADIFSTVFGCLKPGGILVTYSAKGDVKRALRSVGFEVFRLPGAPGKRHMLRAVKK